MKNKKIVVIILIIISLFAMFAVTNLIFKKEEKKEEMVNKTYGEYNGIYKYKNNEFRIFHKDNMIYFRVYKKASLLGNNSTYIDSNKVKVDDYSFEFKDKSLIVKSNFKDIPSATYKKTSGYSTNEIYNDYIGDVSLYNKDFNGVYENNGQTINIVQINNNEIRIEYATEEEETNIPLEHKDNNNYNTDFFGTKYDILLKNNELDLNVYEEANKNDISGTYIKVKELSKEEIIDIFFSE